jgi:glycine/D-amino acid oxidase-like deaminating enzyme
MGYRRLSLWHDSLTQSGDDDLNPRPSLASDTEVDVAIVGGGFTGLWTAYYLLEANPQLKVAVIEAEIAGFGASGRNGGWCSSLFPVSTSALARKYGRDAALAMRRAMNETVNEVGRVAAAEGVDCHWAKGGTVWLARSRVQLQRAEATVAGDATFDGVDGFTLLTADDARARANATGVLGGVYTEHCARIQPARLVRGLARLVEARGGTVYEGTRVTAIRPRAGNHDAQVETERGTVRAHQVVRATEAWTSTLPGNRRDVVPVYSLMIATEPLPASFWDEAGLSKGETFSDERHLIVYGQRTADDRLVFGGRGAPYHWGSGIRAEYDREPAVFSALKRTVTELFPGLGSVRFTHAWGGPLGIPRDWHASVGLDPATGIGWAGGYVGDGVGTTNLSGRTLADLLTGADTELTRLPWVGHRSPRWEPEPLRWLGVNAGLQAMTVADTEERLTGRASITARLMAPFIGH